MVVASFTNSSKQYEVTVSKDGQAVDCQCGDHFYRKHTCKHMSNAQTQIDAEIAKAERFLAIKAQVERAEIEARENQACYTRMMSNPW